MVISKKEFEEENFKVMTPTVTKVIEFLKGNKENAYTSKEVCGAINVSQPSVASALKKLNQAGIVEIKKPYYIFKSVGSGKKTVKKEEESIEE
jgi:Mn-dependent DtxR family transcriptional regulator